jgi:hypothetical protein
MKIYKVELDARNPIEKIVKVPYNSEYNLELSWCGKLFPPNNRIPAALKTGVGYNEICIVGQVPCTTPYSTIATGFANPCTGATVLPVVTKGRPEITYTPNLPITDPSTGRMNYNIVFNPIKVIGIDEDYYEVGGSAGLKGIKVTDCGVEITSDCGNILMATGHGSFGDLILAACSGKIDMTAGTTDIKTHFLYINNIKIDIDKLIADYKKS